MTPQVKEAPSLYSTMIGSMLLPESNDINTPRYNCGDDREDSSFNQALAEIDEHFDLLDDNNIRLESAPVI